jgi:aldehyde:ferredoxin oxidoreductase
MKWAGLDFITIEGRAEEPVYVYIDDGGCEIRDAGELWGRTSRETQESLGEIHGSRVCSACIGPAAEKLVLYSVIVSGRRTASRGGVGAVMGSKNLKAVTINIARRRWEYDQAALRELVKEQINGYHAEGAPAAMTKYFSEYGTGSIERANTRGFFPVRNFRYGLLEGYEGLTYRQFSEITQKHTGCYNCILHCGKFRTVSNGPYAGFSGEGPEYETIWSFTGPIDNNDIGLTVAANDLCDELGLDTISTGNTIGFAFELFEKGLIDAKDTDGLELTWGNHAVVLPLIKKIARREGFGDLLAKGTKRMAEDIGQGSMDYAMQAKGLELPGYDPRALKAMGFGFATSNIGGNQNYSYAFQEVFKIPVPRPVEDPFAEEGKADIVKFNQEINAVADSAIACVFPVDMGLLRTETLGKLLAVATGVSGHGDPAQLMKVGQRICNLERAFNVRDGFSRKDDTLPKRILTEPLRKGSADGQVIKDIEAFLDEFYDECGWTRNGIPTPEKLRELGLEAIINDIREFL